jgi:sulfonate transport system permease protein
MSMWLHELVLFSPLYDQPRAAVPAGPKDPGTARSGIHLRLVLPLTILLLWEAVARTGIVPAYNFPPPTVVLGTLIDLARSGVMFKHLGVSALRVLLGFAIGAGFGTILGALTGFSNKWREVFDGTVQSVRSIPIIAWVPVFILWLGIDEAPKICLIAIGAFFPVYLNLFTGLRGVDRKLIEVGRANRMSGWRLVCMVMLPGALPAYLVGLRTGLALSWMFVAAAELLGASSGIGYMLLEAQSLGRPAVVIASMILFGICGKATDLLLAGLSGRLLHWQDTISAER